MRPVRGTDAHQTDHLAECGLNLPTYNTLGIEDIDYIADRIRAHGRG